MKGHVWGHDVKDLLEMGKGDGRGHGIGEGRYDLLLLSDLVFNHSQLRPPPSTPHLLIQTSTPP